MSKLYKFFNDNKVIGIAILLNTISLFLSGYNSSRPIYTYIDCFFTLFFLAEAITKIKELSFQEYWKDSWNKFDFIITILALPSLINLFGSVAIPSNVFLSLRLFRIFRAIKMVKATRMLHLIPNLSQLMKSVKMAMKTCVVVIIALIILVILNSIIASTVFGEIVPEYFGTPGQSLYTTFRIFTIEGWYEIPDLIASRGAQGMAVFAKIYFCLLLFFGGIIGMSLVNSLFVDAMAEDNNDEVIKKLNELNAKLEKLEDKMEEKS